MTEQFNESIAYIDEYGLASWMIIHKPSNRAAMGATEAEARALFEKVHNQDLPPYRVVRGRPPLPRRDDAPRESEPAIDADERHRRGYGKYRELLKQFHPDMTRRKFSADEITQALVELWQAVR